MRPAFKMSVGLLVLLLSACELKVKQAKTPPAPQPTVARAEPPPAPPSNDPLSIPQTQVKLPEPQPIAPEAVATPPTPPEPASPRPKPKKRPAPQPPAASPAKPEPVETAEAPPATDLPPRRMEPVLPEDQRRQRVEEISNRLHEVDQMLTRVTARGLSDSQKRALERIRSFTARAYKAKDQGDIQTASGLADRALLLAQELDRAR
jgi:outer membrane biosynthesis protein TonB